jgi:hypothetical protein
MMYPYAEFLIDFNRKHNNRVHENSVQNTKAAVIVETRPLFFLPMVLRNVAYFLGNEWNLYILCGELNERFVREATATWSVNVTALRGIRRLETSKYNSMLTSREFWQRFSEEKILVFQVDSLMCGSNIGEFLQYDYVGAPCVEFSERYVANGGFSLRTRSKMLQAIDEVPYSGEPEDAYFTAAMRQLGARMPDVKTASRFAVEVVYTEHPVGVHGIDKGYHSVEDAVRIVRAIKY